MRHSSRVVLQGEPELANSFVGDLGSGVDKNVRLVPACAKVRRGALAARVLVKNAYRQRTRRRDSGEANHQLAFSRGAASGVVPVSASTRREEPELSERVS